MGPQLTPMPEPMSGMHFHLPLPLEFLGHYMCCRPLALVCFTARGHHDSCLPCTFALHSAQHRHAWALF